MASKTINLALQGGGAHGAYTWGVLDRLLEDERIDIEGISGTSAGAMNAAILVDGFAKGGRSRARDNLSQFWRRISEVGSFSPMQQTPWDRLMNGWNMDSSPSYMLYDIYSRMFSPYNTNPFNLNPMQKLLEEMLDIKNLNKHKGIQLFITATSVRSGQARVFTCREITIDVLLASACLPFLFQAVEVDGDHYWDGGYMGNPSLWPLIYECKSHDIMLVQINPFTRSEVPKTSAEIIDRVNEISFNASLIGELRAISFASRLVREKKVNSSDYKDLRMHLIFSPQKLHELNASSKMNVNMEFFQYLHDIGYNAADEWLHKNFDQLGVAGTFHFHETFQPKTGKAAA